MCLDWGYDFLTSLKNLVRHADSGEEDVASVWRAKFAPGSGINVERLDAAGVDDVANGEDRVGFLPRWYWDEIRRERHAIPAERMNKNSTSTPVPPLAKAGWQI